MRELLFSFLVATKRKLLCNFICSNFNVFCDVTNYGYYNSTIYLEAGTHTQYTVINIYSYNTKERLPVKVNKPVDRKRKHCTNGSNVKICQDIESSRSVIENYTRKSQSRGTP